MTRTTTTDASEGLTTCADLVVTLEASKASPPSPTLEGETTLEAIPLKQRRWLAAGATPPTDMNPAFVVSNIINSKREAAKLHCRLLIMAHNSGLTDQARNNVFGGSQR
jgi:hypothetical protein